MGRPGGGCVGDRFRVCLASGVVAVHYRRERGTPRVTLPEHAVAIRRLARRGSHSLRGRGRTPQFEQLPPSKEGLDWSVAAPVVAAVSLERYEELLGGVS